MASPLTKKRQQKQQKHMDMQTRLELKQRKRHNSCRNSHINKEFYHKPQLIQRHVFSPNPKIHVKPIPLQQEKIRHQMLHFNHDC